MLLSGEADRPELLRDEAALWRSAIAGRCGLDFGAGRERTLSRGLWGRAREVGARSYAEYRRFLAGNGAEWQPLIERLVNPETRFWRHAPSFEALVEVALPELLRERTARFSAEPLRIWSAGCSTGEEAYSLAIAALLGPGLRPAGRPKAPPVRVLGTDLCEASLARARRGCYGERSVGALPPKLAPLGLRRPADDPRRPYEVAPEVRAAVAFAQGNLTEDGAPEEPQDVIFCQNVLLYFHPDLRTEVVRRLVRHLAPGGFLFLAPGEIVGLRLPELSGLRCASAAVYRRNRSPRPAAEES